MTTTPTTPTFHPGSSRRLAIIGWIITSIPTLFLLMDAILKLLQPVVVTQSTLALGYQQSVILPLGILLLTLTVLYVVPRTAFLGAVLLTGYLGGAVATHVRLGNPVFSHILFPVYIGVLLWVGLYLRNARFRSHIQSTLTV